MTKDILKVNPVLFILLAHGKGKSTFMYWSLVFVLERSFQEKVIDTGFDCAGIGQLRHKRGSPDTRLNVVQLLHTNRDGTKASMHKLCNGLSNCGEGASTLGNWPAQAAASRIQPSADPYYVLGMVTEAASGANSCTHQRQYLANSLTIHTPGAITHQGQSPTMLLLPSPVSTLAVLLLLSTLLLAATEDYYNLLGLSKTASDREIKRAYRTLSKKYHPDKNPNNSSAHAKFVEVAEAYEALSDSNLRKIYDQYGHEGLKQHQQGQRGGGGHHDPFDLFSRFFGGGGHFGHGGGQRRGPDMEVRMQLPLKDFYNGRETEFTVEKQQICEDCEGSGSADGVVETCQKCGGRGAVIQKHMLAPGIFQQVQMQCDGCGGKGKSIKHACPVCGGARVVRRPVTLTAVIEKGMPKGTRLKFENEADESPDYVAGDMVLTLQEQEPKLSEEESARADGTFFRRKDNDLWWKEVLSLREAWMGGWTRNLTHLDGHVVRLSRDRGQVVQPGQVDTVKGEGMPIYHEGHLHEHHDGDEFGKLYVEYVVVLPDQMEKPMEKDFWALWEKWRLKKGIDLGKDSGRPSAALHGEL